MHHRSPDPPRCSGESVFVDRQKLEEAVNVNVCHQEAGQRLDPASTPQLGARLPVNDHEVATPHLFLGVDHDSDHRTVGIRDGAITVLVDQAADHRCRGGLLGEGRSTEMLPLPGNLDIPRIPGITHVVQ